MRPWLGAPVCMAEPFVLSKVSRPYSGVGSHGARFLIVSLLAAATNASPDYFPMPIQLFRFPDDKTFQIVARGLWHWLFCFLAA